MPLFGVAGVLMAVLTCEGAEMLTDRSTLTQFLIEERRRHPGSSGELNSLILDVARFKYPPHWVSAERLWEAMSAVDPSTGKSRGWLTLRARSRGAGVGFSIR